MKIIDSHQHVFWSGRDDKYLIADMNKHGVASAWLLTWEIAPWEDHADLHQHFNPLHLRADGTHAGIPLCDAIVARDRYPERFVLGYCPHPLLGDAATLLRAAVAMHGVGVCGEWEFQMPFDDPRCLELFRAAGEMKLPVVFHLDVPYLKNKEGRWEYQPRWLGGTVENLERALIACPETTFVGHAPGFWREISGDAADDPAVFPLGPVRGRGRLWKLLDEYPNLWADLSAGSGRTALTRDPKNAREFLVRYADKLLFGRDQFGDETYRFLQTLKLPVKAQEKIYYRNAQRLLAKGQS